MRTAVVSFSICTWSVEGATLRLTWRMRIGVAHALVALHPKTTWCLIPKAIDALTADAAAALLLLAGPGTFHHTTRFSSFAASCCLASATAMPGPVITRPATTISADCRFSSAAAKLAESATRRCHILTSARIAASLIRLRQVIFLATRCQVGLIGSPTTGETHLPRGRALQIGANLRMLGVRKGPTVPSLIKAIAVDGRSTGEAPRSATGFCADFLTSFWGPLE